MLPTFSVPTAERKRSVLLVDDHPMIRQGLTRLINRQPDLTVCCEAGNAEEALRRVDAAHADLAIVDLSLAGRSGLELIKEFRVRRPEMAILVVSMHDELVYAERALHAGARGYIMKTADGVTLLKAIRQVLAGGIYVSPQIAERVVDLVAGRQGQGLNGRSSIDKLTNREFEVFRLIGEGCTRREVAQRLSISSKTVDVHRKHLKEKLKLSTASALNLHAIHWVEKQNLTTVDPQSKRGPKDLDASHTGLP